MSEPLFPCPGRSGAGGSRSPLSAPRPQRWRRRSLSAAPGRGGRPLAAGRARGCCGLRSAMAAPAEPGDRPYVSPHASNDPMQWDHTRAPCISQRSDLLCVQGHSPVTVTCIPPANKEPGTAPSGCREHRFSRSPWQTPKLHRRVWKIFQGSPERCARPVPCTARAPVWVPPAGMGCWAGSTSSGQCLYCNLFTGRFIALEHF